MGLGKVESARTHLWSIAQKEIVNSRPTPFFPIRYADVLGDVDVRAIRSKLGLSQGEFAKRYSISSRSVQEWEQGRRKPESAVRAYLTVISRNPRAVEVALANK
jgi:putative transcriptional regulator